jgi:hypothetical protein
MPILKKILLTFSVFFFFLIFSPQVSIAQEITHVDTPYETSYKAYLTEVDSYQSARQLYILKKAQYLSLKTLKAQDEAQSATVEMLRSRDEVMVKYLKAIEERVSENPGLSDFSKKGLLERLEREASWFSDHKNKIPTAGSLKDLAEDSSSAKKEFELAMPIIYEALLNITNGRLIDMDQRMQGYFTELKDKLVEIKSEQREGYVFSNQKIQRLDDWVFQADTSINRARQKQESALLSISKSFAANKNTKNYVSSYDSIISSFLEAQGYMRETGGFLMEIIKDVKTQE